MGVLVMGYLWIKAAHVIAAISWMAGLLYLPRLFVYHAAAPKGSEQSETFKVMERRLLRYIMAPAMIATWAFGLLMAYVDRSLMHEPWIHVKLLCVILLTGAHYAMTRYTKKFARDENARSAKFYRILNEVPTVLMIVIVIMVIVRPF